MWSYSAYSQTERLTAQVSFKTSKSLFLKQNIRFFQIHFCAAIVKEETQTYSEPCQTFKTVRFAKTFKYF